MYEPRFRQAGPTTVATGPAAHRMNGERLETVLGSGHHDGVAPNGHPPLR
jgi:hypothetical protein